MVAKAPGAEVYMLLQLLEQPRGRNIQETALTSMTGAGFRHVRGERTSIGGLEAYVGVYEGQIEGLGPVGSRAAHIAYDGRVYLVAGLVPVNAFTQADGAFGASIRSFRRLSAAEAESIRPNRVDFHVVRAGDTWESLAARSAGAIRAAALAVMNNAAPGSQPQPGSRIKIVVTGN